MLAFEARFYNCFFFFSGKDFDFLRLKLYHMESELENHCCRLKGELNNNILSTLLFKDIGYVLIKQYYLESTL